MVTKRFNLNKKSLVIEIASNDGFLLQYFLQKKIPVIGIEPSSNIVKISRRKGISTIAFTGVTGGKIKDLCDAIIVPSNSTEKIQEVHIMLGHILCYLIEEKLFRK